MNVSTASLLYLLLRFVVRGWSGSLLGCCYGEADTTAVSDFCMTDCKAQSSE